MTTIITPPKKKTVTNKGLLTGAVIGGGLGALSSYAESKFKTSSSRDLAKMTDKLDREHDLEYDNQGMPLFFHLEYLRDLSMREILNT